MRVTLWLDSVRPWPHLLELAGWAEAAGWDALRLGDQTGSRAQEASAVGDCWAVLGALAETVPRVSIEAVVEDETGRHPAVVAKLASTLDQLSGGRLLLGLAPANDPEGEPRLSEAIEVIRNLTTTERTTFSGTYYQLRDAPLDPKPIQHPFPIMLVGGSPALAASHADHWSITGPPNQIESQLAALDESCRRLGRERSTITVSAVSDQPRPHPGVDGWVVPESALGDKPAALAQIRALSDR